MEFMKTVSGIRPDLNPALCSWKRPVDSVTNENWIKRFIGTCGVSPTDVSLPTTITDPGLKFVEPELNPNQKCYLKYCNHEQNTDLPNSFCGGSTCTTKEHATDCRNHWVNYGKAEGRQGNPDDCIGQSNISRCYLGYCNNEQNSDLPTSSCGGSKCTTEEHANSCRVHWVNYGKAEGRAGNPDECLKGKTIDVLVPFKWGETKRFSITHNMESAKPYLSLNGTYKWINEDHPTSGIEIDNAPGIRTFYKGYYIRENGGTGKYGKVKHALVRQKSANGAGVNNELMFILNAPGIYKVDPNIGYSESSKFSAVQWYTPPSNQLPNNLTGVKFTSYDWAKPEITLPEIFNSFKIGQTIAIYSKYNKSFIRINGDNGNLDSLQLNLEENQLPKEWEWERFKIIDAGNDEIALYNVNLKRFILMNQNNEMS